MTQSKHSLAKVFTTNKAITHFVAGVRRRKQSIVLTQGVFDLVHIGHARYCERAKSFGDILIVGVDSDEKVRARKGPDRPVVPEEERMEMLTYLRSVDAVVLKNKANSKFELVKAIQPDVLVVTEENHAKYNQEQRDFLDKHCGKVVVLEPMAVTTTSAKIRLLQIGAAKKISATLSQKLIHTIEDVLKELKGDEDK